MRFRKGNVMLPIVLFLVLALIVLLAVLWFAKSADRPQSQDDRPIAIGITIVGEDTVTVEYGEEFKDPGASASWSYEDEPHVHHAIEVTSSSEVDLSRVGAYSITYTARYDGIQAQAVRKVLVVDTKAPVIKLVSDPDKYTLPNQEYEEEGFRATDNYDGDITDKVVRSLSEDGKTVTYQVSDSSGNKAEVVRQILFGDEDAPVLTLKGNSKITITAGDNWKEPGYTAIDAVDGDLTDSVKISGSVNHRTAGTYVLTYSVADQFGNTATAQRTVVVKAVQKPEVVHPDGDGKIIYLTFDDGPSKHTERLLKVLDKYNVKATFFVVKTSRLDLLDDIAAGGHTIGIHSKTHKYDKIYASEDAFFEDFYAMYDLIEEYSGVTPTISRFPGGSSNSVSKKHCVGIMTRLTQAVQDLGFQYFDWNIDSDDAGGTKTTEGVYQNVTNRIAKSKQNQLVVLQHDSYGYSVDAVEQIIIWGLEHGYTFAALTEATPPCHHSVTN